MTDHEFLSHFKSVKGSGPQYSARCPAHDDQQSSLSIHVKDDGTRLVQCHAGCSADNIIWAANLTMQDLFPEPTIETTWKRIATYPYIDLDGKYAEKVRKESNTGKKAFTWQQPNGRGGYIHNRQGVGYVLYNTAALADADHVFVVEGEKDVDTLAKHGIVAVCGMDGAGPGKWKAEYTEQLRDKHVAIIQDNDDAGKAFAIEEATALNGIAASVRVLDLTTIWPELPEHGDVSDLIAHNGEQAVVAVREMANNAPYYTPGLVIHEAKELSPPVPASQTSQPPKLVFYDTVDYEEPDFLIKPYIPLGKLTIIQADSGVGKTALACKLAACVSRGIPMQAEPCEKGKVLILSVEDDPSTLRGRIEASGGDLTQCAFLDNAHELTFTSEIIETTIKENGIKFVVFDPLQAFLGAGMNMQLANETRPIMAHLAAMAKRTGCAVVIISHMSKGTAGSKAVYRALGSVDIVAASRSVLYVERNPDDEEQCVILHIKSSNAKPGQSILYRIGDRGGVQWEGYSALTYDDLQVQAERKEKGIEYEEEPLVQVISMFHQDNPQGAFASWEQLDNYANRILGYFPCKDGKDWNARLKRLQREFTERNRILFEFQNTRLEEHMEFGEKVIPEEKKKVRGVRIIPFKPRTEFQIGWDGEKIGDEWDGGTHE
ncbi:AAA family ATPase [Eubacteriales bacterium OttesenSCG-928-A19]|nr:AAA family ATPase [Eubacteriales bacterium OttesenSCG-928-A19]